MKGAGCSVFAALGWRGGKVVSTLFSVRKDCGVKANRQHDSHTSRQQTERSRPRVLVGGNGSVGHVPGASRASCDHISGRAGRRSVLSSSLTRRLPG